MSADYKIDKNNLLHFTVEEQTQGMRLDRFLSDCIAQHSRSYIQELIKNGHVCLVVSSDNLKEHDNVIDPASLKIICESKYRVKLDEVFVVQIPELKKLDIIPQDIPLDIVYEDAALLVIDKPAGLTVHPSPGHWDGTLVNALLWHCGSDLSGINGVLRPGIVHRLDKDTSGLLVVAKSDQAHQSLSEQFAAHGKDGRMERRYMAFVWGKPEPSKGKVESYIGRHPHNRLKMAVVSKGGKTACTHYETLEFYQTQDNMPKVTKVMCQLETGRTHQIRVHMASLQHPLLGDAVYGAGFATRSKKLNAMAQEKLNALGRQALHAYALGFEHPVTHKKLRFESQLPKDLSQLEVALRA